MAHGRINLEFPLGGIDRSASHQHVRPFTTQDAQNVRPYDVLDNRARGGSRPGLAQAFSEQLGSGAYVNLMGLVRTANVTPTRTFQDHFTDVDDWTNAGWDDENVSQSGTVITGPTTNGNRAAIFKTAALDIDWNADLVITMTINETVTNRYRIFARMDQASPNVSSSLGCEVEFGASSTTVRLTKNDVEVDSKSVSWVPDPFGSSGTLQFTIRANSLYMKVQYFSANRGYMTVVETLSSFPTAGYAIAVEMEHISAATAPEIDAILVAYTATTETPQSQIVAGSNGTLYSESTSGALTTITGTPTFGADYDPGPDNQRDVESTPLSVAARFEKLYIADWAEPRKEVLTKTADATIADGTGVLTHTGATFQTDGVVAGGDVIEITAVTGTVATGWYEVDAVGAETELTIKTLADPPAAPSGATTYTAYRIVPGIKIYDATTDAVTLMVDTGAGVAPYGCRIVKLYRDRLVFSGDPNNPGDVFMSKQGDPLDYDYDADVGVQDAFAFDAGGLGRLGAPTTSLIPVFDDLMMVAGEGECSVLRGDPAVGGTFDHLSRRVGVISFDAWAPTDDDQIYFLSIDGLYRIHRTELGGLVEPRRVSPDRIPDELREIDPDTHHVFLEYDPEYLGIWIRIASLNSGDSEVWWYDMRLEGFFRDRYAEDHDAFCGVIDDLPNRSIIGCRDGYVRKYSQGAADDDGTSFTSYADIGPIRLGAQGRDGYLDDIDVALAGKSGDCTLTVRHGKTPEQAKNAGDFATRALVAGLNPSFRPRMRGRDAYVRIQGDADARWALEFMEAEVKPGGRLRA